MCNFSLLNFPKTINRMKMQQLSVNSLFIYFIKNCTAENIQELILKIIYLMLLRRQFSVKTYPILYFTKIIS